ncbi:MAG: hypothetical protein ACREOG_12465, partial [Gemmatimonadaceae bacterium]
DHAHAHGECQRRAKSRTDGLLCEERVRVLSTARDVLRATARFESLIRKIGPPEVINALPAT